MCILRVLKFVVGPLDTNCYLIYDSESRRGIVIDPGGDGDEVREVVEWVARLGLEIVAVVATHGHFDHYMGAQPLTKTLGAPFYMNHRDLEIARASAKWARYFGYPEPELPAEVMDLREGMRIRFGSCIARIIETPGHSPGSTCIFVEEGRALFSGDTLFAGTVGRTDLPGGCEKELLRSLAKIFTVIPLDSLVYPGHGPETSLAREKRVNVFVEEALRVFRSGEDG